jgi:predicted permease
MDDLRYALRALRKNPMLSAVAVLSLGIGIGGNAAIFSLIDRVLLRSLPVADPASLVLLRSPGGRSGSIETSYSDDVTFSWTKYRAFVEQGSAIFAGVIARFPFGASIASRAQADMAQGELVTGNYFDVLGIRPALGRLFTPEDSRSPGANPVVVLSHGYWTRRFGADPGVLNQSLVVNGTPLTIVGVSQAGFRSVGAGEAPEVFVPVSMATELSAGLGPTAWENPHAYWINVFARLKPGVTREQALASMAVIWQRVITSDADQMPAGARRENYLKKRIEFLNGGAGISAVRSSLRGPLYLLMGMVGLVLLIACANVANLLLARAAARSREMAIRVSLGAGRGRLARHVMLESMLLAIGGGLVGLSVASWAGSLMLGLVPEDMPTAGISAEID